MSRSRNVTNGKIVVLQFTEDLVGSVVHVLNYRQELRGWTPKTGLGPPPRVQVLAAQLFSEMDLRGKCPVCSPTETLTRRLLPRGLGHCELIVKFRDP